MASEKDHMSVVICGHVDSGKSTTTGRLLFELGGIPEREMQKLKEEADRLGKGSFAFAFYMDTQKDERERGVTIKCTTKEFFTEKYHYSIIDAPGHRDFIKNMISGAAQADVAVLMVPADGNFTTAIQKGDHKQGQVQGQTRQHARLINLLGVKQLVVCVNKMDAPETAEYKEDRFKEIAEEMKLTLIKVGWPKPFVLNRTPVIPISGWHGDNLIDKTKNMAWWNGQVVKISKEKKMNVVTLKEALNDFVQPAVRNPEKPMRLPISGVYKIKGVGDVLTGRVEQGAVKPGEEVMFLPTHTKVNPCEGKIFTVEMHHKRIDAGESGDNVGMNVKNLKKENMPRVGDVMIYKSDKTLDESKNFSAQVQVLDIPGSIKCGYSPIGHVRCGRAACRLVKLNWKMGKDTGGEKAEGPVELKTNDAAEAIFVPQQPLVVDTFENCDGLSRIAFMDGNSAVMLGKVVTVNSEDTWSTGDKKSKK
jgi:elongation factor 1-alpha